MTLDSVTNGKGFQNLLQTKCPFFCPEASLKEKGFYINISTEVKFTKTTIKLSDNSLKML